MCHLKFIIRTPPLTFPPYPKAAREDVYKRQGTYGGGLAIVTFENKKVVLCNTWRVLEAVAEFLRLSFVPLLDRADVADDARIDFRFLEIRELWPCFITRAALRL